MNNKTMTSAKAILRDRNKRGARNALLLCLAILVVAGVAGIFHMPAIAKTYQVTQLTCTAVPPEGPAYADFFVHIHNDDCVDADGNLDCPLPEIRPHRHAADCYTTTRTLVCAVPESNGHRHTAGCYTRVRGDQICERSTEPVLDEEGNVLEEGHVHTDECFAWTEELTCGLEAGEGAHHHDESCFETITALTCDQPEILLHTHTEGCYQKNEDGSIYVDEDGNTWLICGQLQVTEHVHGPECFTTYELDDGEPEVIFMEEDEPGTADSETEDENTEGEAPSAEEQETDPRTAEGSDADSEGTDAEDNETADSTEPNADEENPEAGADEAAPIVEESHTVVYTGTRGAEMSGMTVLAEIPEGALDENVQLILTDADENAARKQILKLINENAAEGEEREIASMLLLDIGFAANGEPAARNGLDPIRVTLRASAIRRMSAPRLFHLTDGTAREVEDVLFDAEAGTVIFTSTTFSPFAVVDLTGEEATEETTEETAEETVSVSMPAQSFTGETDGVIVSVEAPEGAFPEGTTMVVSPVDMDDDTLSNVTDAVESSGGKKVVTAQAVDISFFDAEQNLIEPKLPIKVSMKSALVSESENVALVHLSETATAEKAETETPEAPAAPAAEVVADVQVVENPDEDNEIRFESDAFSVYVLVGTETITTRYLTADGQTYLITLTCGPEAMIPEGATLAVAEIPQDSEEYATYLAQAQSAVNAGAAAEVTNETAEAPEETDSAAETENAERTAANAGRVTVITARFFDITIHDAEGNPVEPAAPVDVKIKYMEPAESAENYQVVHFGAETEVLNPAVSGTDGSASAFNFQTSSFSVFGVVGTKIIEADVLLSDGNLYTVSVTYDEDAHIPSGSSLRVVPFEEGTPEYEYARNSVLADKKERGEWVDLSSFGLAALDISILNPDGEEIEPKAPVQVEIRIKELPGVEDLSMVADTLAIQHHVEVEDGVVVETVYGGNAEVVFRMETNETVAAEGIVVDPNAVREEDFAVSEVVETDELDIEFETATFSTFTISWNGHYGNNVKVHYVDENGNDLDVKNTTFLTTLNGNATTPAYLIYDIEGYEYDHTSREYLDGWQWRRYNIVPQLRRYDNGWAYSSNGSNWYYLSYNNPEYSDEIYVVYKKKADIAQGGTPTVKQSGDVDPPVAPRINKESTPNGDDTNTLALSIISDTAKLEVEKLADVIVVFDVSGSMNDADMKDKDEHDITRLQAAKDAVNNLATHLADKKNSAGEPLVRMSLIQFSTKASPVISRMTDLDASGLAAFTHAVDGLSASGGTNWDHALQLANEENDLDPGRGTFVIFVTDGDPTFRNARMNVTDADLAEEKNYHKETDTYTDPNYWYLSDTVYGPGNNDRTGQCYAAAVQQGLAIRAAGKNLYTIGISNEVTKISTFNTAVGGNGAYLVANQSELEQAFSNIEASISGAAGWGNIKMTDGITNLSNTVQKTGLVNVGGDFEYFMAPAPENWATMPKAEKNVYKPATSAFEPWDPVTAGAALAQYNETTGAVEWNMGSTFMPEAGVTYQVRFKVWPSQEAYDYIARLNNGTINYNDLPQSVRDQIIQDGNTYTLKTNEPNANTTYQAAIKTGNTVTVSGETKTLMFPTVKDLNLSVDKMKVTKEWINSLDPDARWKSDVTLLLTDGAGNLYKSIELNEKNNYTAEDNFISCGLAKIEDGELVIYEKGHDFKLTEPAEYAYYWDLDSQIYRPMVINAQLTMLEKTDAPSGMGNKTYYEAEGIKYYKIEGGTYKTIATDDAAASITATNIRRSNLNLTKKVVDDQGNPVISSDAFTFTITINDPKDADVWFSVQTNPNDTSTIVKNLTTNATAEVRDGKNTGYYYAASGSAITVSIEPGWNLRFTNLKNGTTYTITESSKEGYDFGSAEIDNNGTFTVDGSTSTGSGMINESNTQYTVTYTNEAVTQHVKIKKTTLDGKTPLAGAVFSLYTESGYNANPKAAAKTGLTSGSDGMIDLEALACGTYYLVETKAPDGYNMLTGPVIIVVTGNGVSSTQSDYHGNAPLTATEKTIRNEDGTEDTYFEIVVTNNPGVELPQTGGEGTLRFLYLGMTVTLGAALLLMTRQRQKKES